MGGGSLMAAAAVLGVTYLTSPYVALYRLSQDMRAGDVDAVQADVDWGSVRAGLKQDVAQQVAGVKVEAVAQRDELPPFGASFVEGVASHVVDHVVTPQMLCQAMHQAGRAAAASAGNGWGMFEGPLSFVAYLHPAGTQPLTLHMRLEGTRWKVTGLHFADRPESRT